MHSATMRTCNALLETIGGTRGAAVAPELVCFESNDLHFGSELTIASRDVRAARVMPGFTASKNAVKS